jgi:hypothetical protein
MRHDRHGTVILLRCVKRKLSVVQKDKRCGRAGPEGTPVAVRWTTEKKDVQLDAPCCLSAFFYLRVYSTHLHIIETRREESVAFISKLLTWLWVFAAAT